MYLVQKKESFYLCAQPPGLPFSPELVWHSSECVPTHSAALQRDCARNGMEGSSTVVFPPLPPKVGQRLAKNGCVGGMSPKAF